MLGAVGIQPSWHVLDAGCGSGSFLPFIADLVGPSGKIYAVDIAKEHIASVGKSVEAGIFPCPVQADVSSTTSLPYPDNTLDAAWCANVSMYLTSLELSTSIKEFSRVVKPGGLVAIKEFDGRIMTFYPGHPLVSRRFLQARYPTTPSIQGHFRAISTKYRMEELGLINVWQQTKIIERLQPLGPIERAFLVDLFTGWSAIADGLDLPGEDKQFWQEQADPDSPNHMLNQPDFFWREGAILAVGQVE